MKWQVGKSNIKLVNGNETPDDGARISIPVVSGRENIQVIYREKHSKKEQYVAVDGSRLIVLC